ncbi:MAG: hypothetical protein OXN19_14135 [Caldilineaceae bacterium]|nr:hypothetical protein [Caldilineaceae bacterium]
MKYLIVVAARPLPIAGKGPRPTERQRPGRPMSIWPAQTHSPRSGK